MRTSLEHTPPFVVERAPDIDYASEVYDLHPAVQWWLRDEPGEQHFADVTRAAIRFDLAELVEARERLVAKWKECRAYAMAEWRRRS